MPDQPSNKLLKVGIIGTVIAALCCFTPIFVITFAALGLGALVGYLDIVLLPALFIFIGITIYALWKTKQGCCAESTTVLKGD